VAISPTALPASSEVAAISCELLATRVALSDTWAIIRVSAARVLLYASSEATVLSRIAPTASATSPISSLDVRASSGVTGVTMTVRSPVATASSPWRRSVAQLSRRLASLARMSLTPRWMPVAIQSAIPKPISSAIAMITIALVLLDVAVLSIPARSALASATVAS
jgi:hypothetical protein